jgi:hypothetical protein
MNKFQKYFFPVLMLIVWLIVLFSNPGTNEKIILTIILIIGGLIVFILNDIKKSGK